MPELFAATASTYDLQGAASVRSRENISTSILFISAGSSRMEMQANILYFLPRKFFTTAFPRFPAAPVKITFFILLFLLFEQPGYFSRTYFKAALANLFHLSELLKETCTHSFIGRFFPEGSKSFDPFKLSASL